MASEKAMTASAPSPSSAQSAYPRSLSSSRKPTNSKYSQQNHSATPKTSSIEFEQHSINRRKLDHKFSCLPDVVGGLGNAEYTTSLMLTDSEPPFSVYALSLGSPNDVDRRHNMSRRIEDIMIPFEAEPHYPRTATGLYPQALPEDVDEALDSQAAYNSLASSFPALHSSTIAPPALRKCPNAATST